MLSLMLSWIAPSAEDRHSVALPWSHAGAQVLLVSLQPFLSMLCFSMLRYRFGNTCTLLGETKQDLGCSMGLD